MMNVADSVPPGASVAPTTSAALTVCPESLGDTGVEIGFGVDAGCVDIATEIGRCGQTENEIVVVWRGWESG